MSAEKPIREEEICFFCKKPVTKDDYCHGCRHFVCSDCDQTTPLGLHKVYDHQEMNEEWEEDE
ncbi:hypothetical protein MUP01_12040 [Candidatus Bathyarchaeota archaeon]|nr:hypothetical protein [Candidatus Bathyarchaeota archaeon]